MRGINFTSAIGLVPELGDLSRFEHPRQLMAWLGVTPSDPPGVTAILHEQALTINAGTKGYPNR
jgi:transposase